MPSICWPLLCSISYCQLGSIDSVEVFKQLPHMISCPTPRQSQLLSNLSVAVAIDHPIENPLALALALGKQRPMARLLWLGLS